MVEVTVQGAEVDLVPVDDQTVLRVNTGQCIINICLSEATVLELVTELTLQHVRAA